MNAPQPSLKNIRPVLIMASASVPHAAAANKLAQEVLVEVVRNPFARDSSKRALLQAKMDGRAVSNLKSAIERNINDMLWFEHPAAAHRRQILLETCKLFDELAETLRWERGAKWNTAVNYLLTFLDISERGCDLVYGHGLRTALYAEMLARGRMGPREAMQTRFAALVHGIGKAGVPYRALRAAKPNPMDQMDVESYPESGRLIMEWIAESTGGLPPADLAGIMRVILSHRELFGGGGYPRGIAGLAIHPSARLVSLLTRFDELTSAVANPLEFGKALEYIQNRAGTPFDPGLTAAFIGMAIGNPELRAKMEAISKIGSLLQR